MKKLLFLLPFLVLFMVAAPAAKADDHHRRDYRRYERHHGRYYRHDGYARRHYYYRHGRRYYGYYNPGYYDGPYYPRRSGITVNLGF